MSKMESPSAEWTDELEGLLICWAEKASGYIWLHDKSSKLYAKYAMWLMIPTSILAYISGGSILSNDLLQLSSGMRTGIGFAAILGGLLSNLQGTLKYKEYSERHRNKRDEYGEFFRDICAELALDPVFRKKPIDYVQSKRQEFDRLIKQSPDIPSEVVALFSKHFQDVKINKPDVVNGVHTIRTHRTAMEEKITIGSKQNTVDSVRVHPSPIPAPANEPIPSIRL